MSQYFYCSQTRLKQPNNNDLLAVISPEGRSSVSFTSFKKIVILQGQKGNHSEKKRRNNCIFLSVSKYIS